MEVEFYRQIFEKCPNIKFDENPFSGSRAVSCGRTDRQTDTRKLTVAFRKFASAPKKMQIGKEFFCKLRSSNLCKISIAFNFDFDFSCLYDKF
jgi:hypothetical protein